MGALQYLESLAPAYPRTRSDSGQAVAIRVTADRSAFYSCKFLGWQTTSRRLANRKVERFDKNITKRGFVPETATKKGNNYPVGPVLLGFFVFVVIGSYFLL